MKEKQDKIPFNNEKRLLNEDIKEEKTEDKVNFGDVAHKELGITTQVASFYLDGLAGYPNLGDGLAVEKSGSYHSWKMPKEDADEFIRRVKEYRKKVLE